MIDLVKRASKENSQPNVLEFCAPHLPLLWCVALNTKCITRRTTAEVNQVVACAQSLFHAAMGGDFKHRTSEPQQRPLTSQAKRPAWPACFERCKQTCARFACNC